LWRSEIVRCERGHVVPSLERLTAGLAAADNSYLAPIAQGAAAAGSRAAGAYPAAADDGRRSRALATVARPSAVLGVLTALIDARVACVLVGKIAEVLQARR
jgi:hypothetical protein